MSETSSRRDFLRLMARQAARTARDLAPLSATLTLLRDEPLGGPPSPRSRLTRKPTEPGPPIARRVEIDEMIEAAGELGLEKREDDLRRLARRSWRLVPGPSTADCTCFAGGTPALPPSISWPQSEDGPLRFIACIGLAEIVSAPEVGAQLPQQGTLWIFHSRPEGASEAAAGGITGVVFDAGDAFSAAAPEQKIEVPDNATPLAASAELTLPRAWSASVEEIGLDDSERDAWPTLRGRLAELQGVEPGDTAPDHVALHRLLGYPDERRGDMPLACELLSHGFDLGGEPPRAHPRATEFEPRSGDWRLLLQLASDDDLGWSWGARRERLYLWASEEDLKAGMLTNARAFTQ